MKRSIGNSQGADDDLKRALELKPRDDIDWVYRGMARAETDPETSLTDFVKAIELNPLRREAYQDKAYVLSDKLHRSDAAIETLDKIIGLSPNYRKAIVGRGVLLARQKKFASALADAKRAEQLLSINGSDGETQYGIACIYALTSEVHQQNKKLALQHLGGALSANFGHRHLATDADLDELRNLSRFKFLLSAARAIRPFKSPNQKETN